jgi:hypothetical protein
MQQVKVKLPNVETYLSDLLRERMLLSTSTVAAARSAALESRLHSIRAEDGWVDD